MESIKNDTYDDFRSRFWSLLYIVMIRRFLHYQPSLLRMDFDAPTRHLFSTSLTVMMNGWGLDIDPVSHVTQLCSESSLSTSLPPATTVPHSPPEISEVAWYEPCKLTNLIEMPSSLQDRCDGQVYMVRHPSLADHHSEVFQSVSGYHVENETSLFFSKKSYQAQAKSPISRILTLVETVGLGEKKLRREGPWLMGFDKIMGRLSCTGM